MLFYSFVLLATLCGISLGVDEVNYLRQFGYLEENSNAIISSDAKSDAIASFQRAFGLQVTGETNAETQAAMRKPRCGVKDVQRFGYIARRRRMAIRWDKNELTYSVRSFSRHMSQGDIRRVVRTALNMWELEADLTFTEVGQEADIELSFTEQRKHERCGTPLEPNVIAHAFSPGMLPISGDVHFNDNYQFSSSINSSNNQETSLLSIAVHEIGHALGLPHNSEESDSVMRPADEHRPWKIGVRDRDKLVSYYGPSKKEKRSDWLEEEERRRSDERRKEEEARRRTPSYPDPRQGGDRRRPQPQPPQRPNSGQDDDERRRTTLKHEFCRSAVDAVAIVDTVAYVFKNEWLWMVHGDGWKVDGPHLISNIFAELKDRVTLVDSVLVVKDEMWIFQEKHIFVVDPYSRRVKFVMTLEDIGLPNYMKHVHLAFTWSPERTPRNYIWGDGEYWLLNDDLRRVEGGPYPRPIAINWKHVPMDSQAAVARGTAVYFIRGTETYKTEFLTHTGTEVTGRSHFSQLWRSCSAHDMLAPTDDTHTTHHHHRHHRKHHAKVASTPLTVLAGMLPILVLVLFA